MWDNVLANYPGQRVQIDGLERKLMGQSVRRWGSPEQPCPQFNLAPGEGCQAVAFDLPSRDRRLVIRNIRQREGHGASKVPVIFSDGERGRAECFVAPGNGVQWEDLHRAIDAIRNARGVVGTGPDYIRTLVHAMELWGIEDPLVQEIWEAVKVDKG